MAAKIDRQIIAPVWRFPGFVAGHSMVGIVQLYFSRLQRRGKERKQAEVAYCILC